MPLNYFFPLNRLGEIPLSASNIHTTTKQPPSSPRNRGSNVEMGGQRAGLRIYLRYEVVCGNQYERNSNEDANSVVLGSTSTEVLNFRTNLWSEIARLDVAPMPPVSAWFATAACAETQSRRACSYDKPYVPPGGGERR
mmetsp:Transcript_19702/g.27048  ORF Transcript_19702/g.27048 Transcript_19702/m.27048 type:complete len:139 (-) Transcript_19702:136-552(-)